VRVMRGDVEFSGHGFASTAWGLPLKSKRIAFVMRQDSSRSPISIQKRAGWLWHAQCPESWIPAENRWHQIQQETSL